MKVSNLQPRQGAESDRLGPGDDSPRLDKTRPGISRSVGQVNIAACRIVQCGVGNGRLGHALTPAGDLIAERTVKA